MVVTHTALDKILMFHSEQAEIMRNSRFQDKFNRRKIRMQQIITGHSLKIITCT